MNAFKMKSRYLQTVLGPVEVDDLGLILPHEHLFTDLRGPSVPDYAKANPDHVVKVIKPYLEEAHAVGVTTIVECSTVGVGRNINILMQIAKSTPIHILAPTGVYRDDLMPVPFRKHDAEALAQIWIKELTEGMENTFIRAGFIKIAMSDDGPTELEIRNLKAAALASKETGAVIASHTPNGSIAERQMEVLLSEGLNLKKFIWVHANLETDRAMHLDAAKNGAYVEFDAIGWSWQSQSALADYISSLIDAGFEERILLSHDAGWYDPSKPSGQPEEAGIQGFTSLVDEFIPQLQEGGVRSETIQLITAKNPARAFAISNCNL
jgi:phosphotriesterase-related protein